MATKQQQMQAQIDRLEAQLAELLEGRVPTRVTIDPEDMPGYIGHGSPEHATFLGLIIVPESKIDDAKEDLYIVYKSRETGKTYRLLDEITILRHYPNIDPEKAALIVLRQKVGSFESGAPKVPDDAPPMWQPAPAYR